MGTVLSLQPKLGTQLRSIPALLPIFFVFIGNDPFSPVLELAQRRGISLGLRMRVFHQGDPAQSHAWLGWAVGAWCFSLSPRSGTCMGQGPLGCHWLGRDSGRSPSCRGWVPCESLFVQLRGTGRDTDTGP